MSESPVDQSPNVLLNFSNKKKWLCQGLKLCSDVMNSQDTLKFSILRTDKNDIMRKNPLNDLSQVIIVVHDFRCFHCVLHSRRIPATCPLNTK